MWAAGHDRPATTYALEMDVDLMPNINANSPVSSAPTDRLALGVGGVRPGVAGVTVNPSHGTGPEVPPWCFEGNEE